MRALSVYLIYVLFTETLKKKKTKSMFQKILWIPLAFVPAHLQTPKQSQLGTQTPLREKIFFLMFMGLFFKEKL